MNRDSAFELLQQHTISESLIKHMLAVEACMRAYAVKFGEDEEKWGIVGLLHDFDYEMYPNPPAHPEKGAAILKDLGYPEDVIYAIKSHAEWTGCPRKSLMDKALFACDELAGFITAVTLVRPDKKIQGLEARSVRKKIKDKAFARSVRREDITQSAQELGIELDEHINFCIRAMEGVARELGL
ncbi:MAG: HDIG domain-containing protein [Acidobacteria bacterium]|nr:HDIG domain-containing protein [Acidobacteriota bacterium]